MPQLTNKDAFLASLERCAQDDGFVGAFYERFLASSEKVKLKFMFTDFDNQEKMLLNSLRLIAGATAGESAALRELKERAKTHDRYHLNISPELYEFWRHAIMATAAEYDEQWDEAVEKAWRSILDHVIKHMVKHY